MRIWEKNFEDINFFLYTKMFGNFHVWILCRPPSDRNIQHAAVNQETKIYQKQSVVRLSGAMSHDKPLSSLPTFGPRDTCWPLAGPHLCHGSFALWSPATSHTRAPYTVLSAGPRRDLNFRVIGHVDCVGQLGGRVLHAVFAAAVLQSHAGGPGAAEATGAGPRGVRSRPVTVFVSDATQHATQNRSYPVHLQKNDRIVVTLSMKALFNNKVKPVSIVSILREYLHLSVLWDINYTHNELSHFSYCLKLKLYPSAKLGIFVTRTHPVISPFIADDSRPQGSSGIHAGPCVLPLQPHEHEHKTVLETSWHTAKLLFT